MPATDDLRATTAAIVVAGGRGRRLGMDVPKAAAPLGGRTLLDRAVATAGAVASEVLVVAPEDVLLPRVAARRVHDPADAEGPLAGVLAGMRALSASAEAAIVFGVDFPLVRASTLHWLRASLGTHRAVVPAPGGTWQPLAAVYARQVFGVLDQQWNAGVRSITRAARALEPKVLNDAQLAGLAFGADAFLNVNTHADLLEAERLLLGVQSEP